MLIAKYIVAVIGHGIAVNVNSHRGVTSYCEALLTLPECHTIMPGHTEVRPSATIEHRPLA